ncbi:MAG: exosome complex RNA-binding protein Rrp4 [Candidatus Woesearchaeota archaeon]|nr:exosome complex RNA-binding protein Rrp4 [Candidatus Woesearchaeota archaeon]
MKMGKILLEDKEIVVPGDIIAEGMDFIPGTGTFREGENIISARLGMISVSGSLIKLVPLSGKYMPKIGDTIVCKVIDVSMSGWRVDTNSAYSAMLSMKDASSRYISRGADLTKYFKIGDYLLAKVINVTSQKLVDMTMKGPGLRKLIGGIVIAVSPSKVPRIIGKNGSMVSIIKEATNCNIVVGQNGLVFLQGAPADAVKAVNAIRKIENEAHISGLTERMEKALNYTPRPESERISSPESESESYGNGEGYERREERREERRPYHEHREYGSGNEHRFASTRQDSFRRGSEGSPEGNSEKNPENGNSGQESHEQHFSEEEQF